METIIGKNLNFTLTGDSFEDLKYKSSRSYYDLSEIRIAKDDGRIIIDETANGGIGGYIPYKKGQIIGLVGNWKGAYIKRPIVFDSPELLAALLEIEEQVKENEEKQLQEKNLCCDCINTKKIVNETI